MSRTGALVLALVLAVIAGVMLGKFAAITIEQAAERGKISG